jgi:hypothetical protein
VHSLQALAGGLKRTARLRPMIQWAHLWLQSEIDLQRGREQRFDRGMRRAIECAGSLPFDRARLQVRLARRLAPEHPERARLLSAAEETFAAIGAGWELAEVRRLAR